MSAKSNVPWSVKGIDQDARSVAKELARRRGLTLGEFITEMIREKGVDETGSTSPAESGTPQGTVVSGVTTDQLRGVVDTLNRLNDRLKAAEGHLALNQVQSKQTAEGLNRGLETVFERVKRLERENQGEPSPDIAERLDRLEGAAEKNSWVKSLVALEKALTTLVEQVENSREDHDERLSRNEDLLTDLQERLQAEDDSMRKELSGLLEAIDSTTERLSETDNKVQEALAAAREAADSRDETFIERTSQRLQLLGSEIKRTSDQIRGLEGQVTRLSEKIEAGEERSAEGISRVAQSLDTLRREVEEQNLSGYPDAPADRVRSAIDDAEHRVERLQGAFAAVVDRLEGREPDIRPAAPLSAVPFPDEALTDDFRIERDTDPEDEFDRVFEDPLNLGGAHHAAQAEPPRPARGEVPPRETFGLDPFGASFVANETPRMTESLFEPSAPLRPSARADAPVPPIPPMGAFDPLPDDDLDQNEWQAPPSIGNPFSRQTHDFVAESRESLFAEHRESLAEKAANLIRRTVSKPIDNNPALGWALLAMVMVAIGITALRLSQPGLEKPMVMEPMSAPSRPSRTAAEVPTSTAQPSRDDASTLYVRAKTMLATAVMPEEMSRAVRSMVAAAEAGSALAQYDLGDIYLNGDGVERNPFLARAWFEEAANNNHLQAIGRLGYLEANGDAGPVNFERAASYFERAANAGHVDSMVNLGRLYHPVEGYLPTQLRDGAEAYFWLRLAAARGDSEAAAVAETLEANLTIAQMTDAEGRLAAWRQKAP